MIEMLTALRESEKMDWWNQLKASIKKGLKDIENGKLIPHEKAKKLYDKWLYNPMEQPLPFPN